MLFQYLNNYIVFYNPKNAKTRNEFRVLNSSQRPKEIEKPSGSKLNKIYYYILIEWIAGKIVYFTSNFIYDSLSNDTNLGLATFALWLFVFVFYHKGEFIFVAKWQFELLNWDSYLIYHSIFYQIAQWFSIFEFWFVWLFYEQKDYQAKWFMAIFGTLGVMGLLIRNIAFHHAEHNFTHLVSYKKEDDHKLITTGIYAYSRHPSYFGYFLFQICFQQMLKNMISVVAYTYVLQLFFKERIIDEEEQQQRFFGNKYIDYRRRVGIGIPFINELTKKEFGV